MISRANKRILALLGFSSVVHAGVLLAYGYLYPQEPPAVMAAPTLQLQLQPALSQQAAAEVSEPQALVTPVRVLVTQSQQAVFRVQPQRVVADLVVPSPPRAAKTRATVSAVDPAVDSTPVVSTPVASAPVSLEPALAKAAIVTMVNEAVTEVTSVTANAGASLSEVAGADAQDSALISSQLGEQLLLALESYFNYPLKARRKGWQGEVRLSVAIGRHGKVTAVRLVSSSGYAVLDQAAIKSMSKVGEIDLARLQRRSSDQLLHQTLPQPLQVEIPIAYRLVN